MKKITPLLLLLSFFLCTVNAQTPQPQWTGWFVPNPCFKGVKARLKMEGPNGSVPGKYMWTFSIFNGYTKAISFEINLLSPQGYAALKAGQKKGFEGVVGRMTVEAGQQVDWGGFDILIPTNTQAYVYLRNVRFGSDDVGTPYATDECGRRSDYDATADAGGDSSSTAGTNGAGGTDGTLAAGGTGAAPGANGAVGAGGGNGSNGAGGALGSNTPAVDASSVIKPAANSNVATTNKAPSAQQQAYQQNATNYANAANNPGNDAIQQSMYNNLAQTNALAAGNTAMVQQLKQQQQQAAQANINAAVSNLANTFGQMAAERQERADMQAARNIWFNQLRLRMYLYMVINNYSEMYMDTTFYFTSRSNLSVYDPWNSGADEWHIYNRGGNSEIKEALAKNDGIALSGVLCGLLSEFMTANSIYFYDYHDEEPINTPFKEKIYYETGKRNEDEYPVYLTDRFVDTRSRRELKAGNDDDVRAILPRVGSGRSFDSRYFDKYVKLFGSQPGYRTLAQWLYQEKANYLCINGLEDKVRLFGALSALDTAEVVCNIHDYEVPPQMPYDVSALLNPEFYWYNLFSIRVGKLFVLNKLSALTSLSAEEKAYINNKVLLTYYQTKNDLVPVFSDKALQAPHEIM